MWMIRNVGLLVAAIVLAGCGLFLPQLHIISLPTALLFSGSGATVASFVAFRRPLRVGLRFVAALFFIGGLALGGWLDLAFWDLERAKPSPHYLGPPR